MKLSNSFGFCLSLFSLVMCTACGAAEPPSQKIDQKATQPPASYQDYHRAYFASGCFWCVEAIYESVKGVKEVHSGYSGGHTENPTYEQTNTGRTGHAETVEVIYDASVVSFDELLDVYFGSQNVEQVNGQGPDRGSQYRSIIFYQTQEEKALAERKKKQIEADWGVNVAAEIKAFEKFWMAEKYHQDYKKCNPNNSYVKAVSDPRHKAFKAKFPELIKEK